MSAANKYTVYFGPSCSLIPSSTLPQGDRQRSPVLLQKRLGFP